MNSSGGGDRRRGKLPKFIPISTINKSWGKISLLILIIGTLTMPHAQEQVETVKNIEEECPCLDRTECPHVYGEGDENEGDWVSHELGVLPQCSSGHSDGHSRGFRDLVRCCGVEVSVEKGYSETVNEVSNEAVPDDDSNNNNSDGEDEDKRGDDDEVETTETEAKEGYFETPELEPSLPYFLNL